MYQMVNNIQLTWKFAWLLRTYRICNSLVEFSKFEFYNKLLGGIILFKVTLDPYPLHFISTYTCVVTITLRVCGSFNLIFWIKINTTLIKPLIYYVTNLLIILHVQSYITHEHILGKG